MNRIKLIPTKPGRAIALALGASLLLPLAASAEWRNSSSQEFVAKEFEKHPRKRTLIFTQPVDAPFGADACFGYANWRLDLPARGKVRAKVEITRQSSPTGPIELVNRLRFPSAKVAENTAADCAPVGVIKAGDQVKFTFKFKGLPSLRPDDDRGGTFQFLGSVISKDCTEGVCVSDQG